MAKMRMLQPKMQEMRERFGDDRQRMSKNDETLQRRKSKSTWRLLTINPSNANFHRIILDVYGGG